MHSVKRLLASHPQIWWWVATILLLALLAGLFQFERRISSAITSLNNEHLNLLSLGNSEFNRQLGDIRNSTRLLDTHIQDLLNEKPSRAASSVFRRVGSTLENVSQLRWLDLDGQEQIRINFSGFSFDLVDKEKLQNKSHRPYVKAIQQSLPGTLLLSRMTLNKENGQVVIPYEPTIRAMLHTAPTHPMGEGFLIVNFRQTELMIFLKSLSSPNSILLMADDTPQWVLHPELQKLWSGKVGGPGVDIEDAWARLASNNAVSMFVAKDLRIFSISKLAIHLSEDAQRTQTLFFIAETPASFYLELRRQALIPASITAAIILLIGAIALYRELITSYRIKMLGTRLKHEKAELQQALALQEQLREELVEIEKMASLGMLVSGVAHELNTPLGAVIMSVSSQQSRLHDLKKQIESGLRKSALDDFLQQSDTSIQLALSNLQRASQLIKRFKRLSVDRSSEHITHFNLLQNASDIINAMGPQLKNSPVELKLDIPKSIYLTSYPGIVSQVLQNLINNSLTHAFSPGQHGIITISANRQDDRVIISIKDDGNGIDPSVADTLFDPFVTSGRHKGNSGLGLHLIHQWVTQVLEGQIHVAAADGGGTVFTLNLATRVKEAKDGSQRSVNS
ncbi:sensor histidine kinase [Salinimonas iocasae]|uniref:histidine kinase n=1 Tax=Salinimonas iocasae TaxID=2572577 RepID=A0A5B7YAU0_9ALTE|nr:HAMP domain-containing sensor histidine kinase [Salinimonas iocasae]QCZ92545.1 HAMP domain-containing histidine kinase [Salinimonas iocasae]